MNATSLAGDAGVSVNTVRAWLSVLEASYLILLLPAWHPNTRKQVVRAAKLHMLDSGLACHLLVSDLSLGGVSRSRATYPIERSRKAAFLGGL